MERALFFVVLEPNRNSFSCFHALPKILLFPEILVNRIQFSTFNMNEDGFVEISPVSSSLFCGINDYSVFSTPIQTIPLPSPFIQLLLKIDYLLLMSSSSREHLFSFSHFTPQYFLPSPCHLIIPLRHISLRI